MYPRFVEQWYYTTTMETLKCLLATLLAHCKSEREIFGVALKYFVAAHKYFTVKK